MGKIGTLHHLIGTHKLQPFSQTTVYAKDIPHSFALKTMLHVNHAGFLKSDTIYKKSWDLLGAGVPV